MATLARLVIAGRAGVFKHMQDHNEGIGVCDTETCRWQISKSSGVKIVHPVWLLHHSDRKSVV